MCNESDRERERYTKQVVRRRSQNRTEPRWNSYLRILIQHGNG